MNAALRLFKRKTPGTLCAEDHQELFPRYWPAF